MTCCNGSEYLVMLIIEKIVVTAVIFVLFAGATSFTQYSQQDLYENDDCMTRDGRDGVCTIFRNCFWFVTNVLRKRIIPYEKVVRCGFNGSDEIVCCPKQEQIEQLQATSEKAPAKNDNSSTSSRVEYETLDSITNNVFGSPGETRKAVLACQNFRSTTQLTYHIIEGIEAEEGDVPYIAALGYETTVPGRKYDWGCGSSLISAKFLLTAAHCIRIGRQPIVARMGALNLDNAVNPDAIQDTPLKKFYPHPEYSARSKYNDIALIEVTKPFQFDDTVNTICLHVNPDDLPPTQTLLASGWGLTVDETRSDKLLKVNLTTEPLDQCDKKYRSELGNSNTKLALGVVKTQYCAIGSIVESSGNRRDSCQGDSGGPLAYTNEKEERFYLVGVTSFGLGCGASASIYTRVAAYLDWIEPIVWPDSASLKVL